MSTKEVKKLEIVEAVRCGRFTQADAAKRLNVSDRCIRYWLEHFARAGAKGLVHGNRGQASPRKVPQKERSRIVSLISQHYSDFTPALAAEKLLEVHGINRHRTTIRSMMVEEGLWVPRLKRHGRHLVVHRQWRERRAHRGELVQFDGSYHHWFEERILGADGLPLEVCLLAAIDDATGELLFAEFVQDEGTLPVMGFWNTYTSKHGLPKAVYLDRFSTYKMTQKVAQDNPDLKTQLQRACATLAVELIFALSPQAKGRVERLFKTLQDRLVKELRLRNISTLKEANIFLETNYLRTHNKKYCVQPRAHEDFHRLLSQKELHELPQTLCRLERRCVMNDFTVSFKTQWYQLLPTRGLAMRPKDEVLVREYSNRTLSFEVRGKRAEVRPITKQTTHKTRRVLKQRTVPTLVPI